MEVESLSFQHEKKGPYFFKNLSFALERGKLHALHGKNGVGKSILLQILAGKVPKGGVITGKIQGGSTQLIPQKFDEALIGSFPFKENLQFGALSKYPSLFRSLPSFSCAMEDTTLRLLDKFHINPHIPLRKLSGGQRQIVSLLMKLQCPTEVLLLDEPTATLDEENADLVFSFLQELKGLTFLMVCHDRELVARYTTGTTWWIEVDPEGGRRLLKGA